jgi:hypothetical protein
MIQNQHTVSLDDAVTDLFGERLFGILACCTEMLPQDYG